MASTLPFVRYDNVQKSYDGESLVVKNLNLDIEKGEFVTMLGPSGSGKTTCLMMLAGFETATHGDILLDGKPINNIPPHRRGIGMVFQNYALFPHMTVNENLAFPLKVRKMDKAETEAKVKRALEMVQMEAFGDRKPAQLSGGQQQRVFIARALAQQADLYLMDEPFAGVDIATETAIFQLLQDMARAGKTVLVVHHDIHSAMNFFEWCIMLNLHLVASGPKDQVMTEELLRKTYGGKLNLLTQVTDLIRKQDFNPLKS